MNTTPTLFTSKYSQPHLKQTAEIREDEGRVVKKYLLINEWYDNIYVVILVCMVHGV